MTINLISRLSNGKKRAILGVASGIAIMGSALFPLIYGVEKRNEIYRENPQLYDARQIEKNFLCTRRHHYDSDANRHLPQSLAKTKIEQEWVNQYNTIMSSKVMTQRADLADNYDSLGALGALLAIPLLLGWMYLGTYLNDKFPDKKK